MQHPRTASGYGRQTRSAPNRRTGNRSRRPSSPVRRTLFHAPSFSAGVVMGAVVVLGAAYLPELLSRPDTEATVPAAAVPEARPKLTFEFDELLRNSRVTADPEPYASEPAAEADAADELILLQAASFRSRDDAERLRAALLLMDLPAATSDITLNSGRWFRVTVGPFDSKIQAQRALTRLREKDIAAIWTKTPVR
ncbi:MAG: SPOR domain-containing protein [Pseudomonadales bacterium]